MVEKISENQSEVNLKLGDCSAFGWITISAEGKKKNNDRHTGPSKEMPQFRLAESVDRPKDH